MLLENSSRSGMEPVVKQVLMADKQVWTRQGIWNNSPST